MIGPELAMIVVCILVAVILVLGGLVLSRHRHEAKRARLDLEHTRHVQYEAQRQMQAITSRAIDNMFDASSLGRDPWR